MSGFLTHLEVENLPYSEKEWILLASLRYRSLLLNCVIEAPKDFETDFSSVPRLPLAYAIWGDRCRKEGVIHDYLYRIDSVPVVPRELADAIFLEAMEACGRSVFVRYPMWTAVRAFGWMYYHKKRVMDRL